MTASGAGASVATHAGVACAFCRRRKRSCDKRLPQCSACASRNLECEYSRIFAPNDYGPQQANTSREWTSTQPLLTASDSNPTFPAVYFLDNRVFQHSRMQLPRTNWTVPPIIADYVGDPLPLALQYWNKVHSWMPIISKKRFYDHSLNPLISRDVDVVLLLSAMRLLLWHPAQEPCPETEYMAIRHAIIEAENLGVFTLQLLQAKILLTIYELGHALYPAAYLSVGSCARFGIAVGVNQCLQATNLSTSPEAALETEEKKRTWWAVLMLDRTMQLGNPTQMLATEEPASSSYLPADDESFESGNITREPFRASSPASIEMGMLARMSQATFILGRVLRFQARSSEFEDEAFRESERLQLDKTLRALLNLVYIEGSVKRIAVCAQSSICYSALIALHDPEARRTDLEQFDMKLVLLGPVVKEMTWASGIWFSERLVNISDASPFLLFWAYQAITIYRRLEARYGNETQQHMLLMKEKLRLMSLRWKAGEAYLQILNAREITMM
ncbi:uncharacterized protein BDZ99DRAFT_23774 [Mytilinidion resinicola]|uniref:Zn(2)-C6 fungal-type domain-containing protein n=1 Tax=Mytilinidion resinicola TaxID=574789 RepID=A0A6A6ZBR5_9PEZI|nr:uncharacterized protein BDZ99DRAFT_23774 [Mytilinidion resinicola]KAF2817754.1 hypothetical protein BDZ99DRAFT_23774 [Mytilinidion resinicola]